MSLIFFKIVSVVIGATELYFAAKDTLGAISTVFSVTAMIPGPHSLVFGGIAIATGLLTNVVD